MLGVLPQNKEVIKKRKAYNFTNLKLNIWPDKKANAVLDQKLIRQTPFLTQQLKKEKAPSKYLKKMTKSKPQIKEPKQALA